MGARHLHNRGVEGAPEIHAASLEHILLTTLPPLRSDKDRPNRQTDHAATMSNYLRLTPFSTASSRGRLARPVAPLIPSSRNTRPRSTNQAVQRPPGAAVAGSRPSGLCRWSRPAHTMRLVVAVAILQASHGSAGRQAMTSTICATECGSGLKFAITCLQQYRNNRRLFSMTC
jgi:hypothetical protein